MGYHPKDSVLRTTQIKFIISIQIILKYYVIPIQRRQTKFVYINNISEKQTLSSQP